MKFFILLCIVVVIVGGTRGIVYSDEGYILQTASRVLSGEVPYRDFHFAYTPLSIYATAFSFLLFGKSIIAGRILMIFISLGSAYLLYHICFVISNSKVISLLSVVTFISWGVLHTNFAWPVMFAICTALGFCWFMLQAAKQKQKLLMLFGASSMVFLTLMAKQNFGVVLLMVFVIAFISQKNLWKKHYMLYAVSGVLIPSFLYICYLFITNSFFSFVDDFYVFTLQRIVIQNTLTTPFLIGTSVIDKMMKFVLYSFPFWICLVAIVSEWKSRKYIFLCFFVLLFYFFGIRPTTDYIHLSPLLALVGIPLAILYKNTNQQRIHLILLVLFIGLGIAGLYTAFFKGYYRWNPPLYTQNSFVSRPYTLVYLDTFYKKDVENLISFIQANAKQSEYIFINSYDPMLYVVTNKKNPTRFDLIEPTDFYLPFHKEIIGDLENKKVPVILTRTQNEKTLLGRYIKKEYTILGTIGGFVILKRK